MFETSVVQARALGTTKRSAVLSVSLLAHSTVVIGAIAVSIATVDFPSHAPDAYSRAPSFSVPPPLGTLDGGGRRAQTPPPSQARNEPVEQAAPAVIPEEVAPLESAGAGGSATDGEAIGTGVGAGPLGVPWGVEDGIGALDAPPGDAVPVVEEPRIYHPGGDVRPPVVIQRVEPVYPPIMLRIRAPATVVVRCVIDRDGKVRDPQVVTAALSPFTQAVVDAVRQWRFRPGTLHGRPVETWLDLKVTFEVR